MEKDNAGTNAVIELPQFPLCSPTLFRFTLTEFSFERAAGLAAAGQEGGIRHRRAQVDDADTGREQSIASRFRVGAPLQRRSAAQPQGRAREVGLGALAKEERRRGHGGLQVFLTVDAAGDVCGQLLLDGSRAPGLVCVGGFDGHDARLGRAG